MAMKLLEQLRAMCYIDPIPAQETPQRVNWQLLQAKVVRGLEKLLKELPDLFVLPDPLRCGNRVMVRAAVQAAPPVTRRHPENVLPGNRYR